MCKRTSAVGLCGALLLFGVACGGSDDPTGEKAGSSAFTDTTAAPVPTTVPSTVEQPSEASGLDAVLTDPSVLSVGLGDEASGRFSVQPGPLGDLMLPVEGTYWATGEGNVYTRLDVDPELIAGEMNRLVDSIEAMGGQPEGSPYLASLRDHYRGNEFQIGITDLVRWIGIGPLPLDLMEQWTWLSEVDALANNTGETLPSEFGQCRTAIESFDTAARTWVDDLEIDFQPVEGGAEKWVFPVQALEVALADQLSAAAVCEEFFGDSTDEQPELIVTVTPEQSGTRIDLFADQKIYIDRGPELLITIRMWPDETVGDPPDTPSPLPLLTVQGTYLTAIGVCGGLPWIYSNFAASDTYYGPDSGGYAGPTIFASNWLCLNDVPEERRND